MSVEHKSGLYQTTLQGFHFTLRLDVDGESPQDLVSVSLINQFPSHWIAELTQLSSTTWEGSIWFRHGSADIVTIGGQIPNRLHVNWFEDASGEFVTMSFHRDFQSLLSIDFERESEFFREVEFELDNETNVGVLTSYDTHDHPRRPATLPQEILTLQEAFGRAGVNVRLTAGGNVFDSTGAGSDAAWTSSELNDAMMANWSRPDGTPWSMWVVCVSNFDNDPGFVTFGIMFDSFGDFHRNGTAVFNTAIEDFYPLDHPDRNATIRRHKFRTLIHEIGHGFNLAHSWQKRLGSSWHPGVVNEREALSFMNYPRRVTGGDNAYWDDFRFQFSNQELEFIRHAPAQFVAMAGEDWFENHADVAIDPEAASSSNGLDLQIRFQRPQPIFDFLEPVRVELKLKNSTRRPLMVPRDILQDTSRLSILVTRNGGETKRLRPYSHSCYAPMEDLTLKPGQSIYGELYLSSAANGWLISDPGQYDVVVVLKSSCECDDTPDTTANAHVTLFVRPPSVSDRSQNERVAQDYFSDEVGRVLYCGGSRGLHSANNCLEDLADRLSGSAASLHAKIALHMPHTRAYKLVHLHDDKLALKILPPDMKQAHDCFEDSLIKNGKRAAETLGHICFKRVTDKYCDALEREDDAKAAASFQNNILKVMRARKAKLPKDVLGGIKERISRCKK